MPYRLVTGRHRSKPTKEKQNVPESMKGAPISAWQKTKPPAGQKNAFQDRQRDDSNVDNKQGGSTAINHPSAPQTSLQAGSSQLDVPLGTWWTASGSHRVPSACRFSRDIQMQLMRNPMLRSFYTQEVSQIHIGSSVRLLSMCVITVCIPHNRLHTE